LRKTPDPCQWAVGSRLDSWILQLLYGSGPSRSVGKAAISQRAERFTRSPQHHLRTVRRVGQRSDVGCEFPATKRRCRVMEFISAQPAPIVPDWYSPQSLWLLSQHFARLAIWELRAIAALLGERRSRGPSWLASGRVLGDEVCACPRRWLSPNSPIPDWPRGQRPFGIPSIPLLHEEYWA
jgi:hypothetical protein